jgi:rSAM/selenodomain-associated transferase 1
MSHENSGREALVVVAKAPRVGDVKTRLYGALGPEAATSLYSCFLRDTRAAMAAAVRARPTIEPVLCYTPAGSEAEFRDAGFDGVEALAQRGGGLGERVRNCFEDLFADGYRAVAAIGADSPTLPGEYLAAAFAQMEGERSVVLGPSADGGYYLVGMRRFRPEIFADISWSTGSVLAETAAAASRAGLAVALLPEWYDVDTPPELDRLRDGIARGEGPARFTRAFLEAHYGRISGG